MPRVYLPLLPLPVLAVLVAFSACKSPPADEAPTRLIPPAAALAPEPPPRPTAPGAAPTGDDAPSPEELRAFARPVAK